MAKEAPPASPPDDGEEHVPAVRPEDMGFKDSTLAETQHGTAVAVHQAEAELRAMIMVARAFPRKEATAAKNLIVACRRGGFAEVAAYSFPRGGNRITGPSVAMAREACRLWGNIRKGLRIISIDEEYVHIKAFAHDTETNQYEEAEDKFKKLIERKVKGGGGKTQWIVPDERDLRELINRRGAILERNAALKILPKDLIEEAMREVTETMRKAAAGELEQDRASAIRRLVLAFDRFGVSPDMLIAKLGHDLELITKEEVAELRQIMTSLEDGNSKREEYFELGAAQASGPERLKPDVGKGKADLSMVKEGDAEKVAKMEVDLAKAKLAHKLEKDRAEAAAALKPGETIDTETGEVVRSDQVKHDEASEDHSKPPPDVGGGEGTTLFGPSE